MGEHAQSPPVHSAPGQQSVSSEQGVPWSWHAHVPDTHFRVSQQSPSLAHVYAWPLHARQVPFRQSVPSQQKRSCAGSQTSVSRAQTRSHVPYEHSYPPQQSPNTAHAAPPRPQPVVQSPARHES